LQVERGFRRAAEGRLRQGVNRHLVARLFRTEDDDDG